MDVLKNFDIGDQIILTERSKRLLRQRFIFSSKPDEPNYDEVYTIKNLVSDSNEIEIFGSLGNEFIFYLTDFEFSPYLPTIII